MVANEAVRDTININLLFHTPGNRGGEAEIGKKNNLHCECMIKILGLISMDDYIWHHLIKSNKENQRN